MAADSASAVLGELESLTKDPKATEDFSNEVQETIPKVESQAKAGQLSAAIDELMILEKKCRQACDAISCSRVCLTILSLLRVHPIPGSMHTTTATNTYPSAGQGATGKVSSSGRKIEGGVGSEKARFELLCEYVVLLCKKRSQLKRVICDVIAFAMSWVGAQGINEPTLKDEVKNLSPVEDREVKYYIIKTLSDVTEGKIFVEVERARLTRMYAHMKEDQGLVEEAANLLQEVQVETFGVMSRVEKCEYILDQMRLVLAKKDYIRLQIISKKINPKLIDKRLLPQSHNPLAYSERKAAALERKTKKLDEKKKAEDEKQKKKSEELSDSERERYNACKLQYYDYLVIHSLHQTDYLEAAKCYWNIFNTDPIMKDSLKWKPNLQCYILYLLLSPFGEEPSFMLKHLLEFEKKRLEEIPMFRGIVEQFKNSMLMTWPLQCEAELKKHSVFQDSQQISGTDRWKVLRKRVIQHNVRVIGKYYTCIKMSRLCELLQLDVEEAESEISELVCGKSLQAKMDRPAGIINFGERKESSDHLNKWSKDVTKLLDLLDESSHFIQKERMVHAARAKRLQMTAKTAN